MAATQLFWQEDVRTVAPLDSLAPSIPKHASIMESLPPLGEADSVLPSQVKTHAVIGDTHEISEPDLSNVIMRRHTHPNVQPFLQPQSGFEYVVCTLWLLTTAYYV
jgi:hypothetical protein